MKSTKSSSVIDNPFVKLENRTWQVSAQTLEKEVSPPPTSRRRRHSVDDGTDNRQPKTAAVEAGETAVTDPVSFFAAKALAVIRARHPVEPRLGHAQWLELFQKNQSPTGHHFVIHQHDHPVAGTHYDLRLQCNETSSISFAIMYGLPGDPNSRRINRNATETRVHNYWVSNVLRFCH